MDVLSLGECYMWARQMDASPARFDGWTVLRIERLLAVHVSLADWAASDSAAIMGSWDISRPGGVTIERWGLLLSQPSSGHVSRVTEMKHLVNFPHQLVIEPDLKRPMWPGMISEPDRVALWNAAERQPAAEDPACRHCGGRGCMYCGECGEEWRP